MANATDPLSKVTTEQTLIHSKRFTQRRRRYLSPVVKRRVYVRVFGLLLTFLLPTARFTGQAIPTASTAGSLLVGGGYIRANPDYSPAMFTGWSVFSNADLWKNVGFEAKFNHTLGPTPNSITETSYEVGVRGRIEIGPVAPFVELTAGIGSFAYLRSPQNGSYGLFAGGGGFDFPIARKVVLRGEYDYQRWGSFPPRGLQPNLVTFGVAYRLR